MWLGRNALSQGHQIMKLLHIMKQNIPSWKWTLVFCVSSLCCKCHCCDLKTRVFFSVLSSSLPSFPGTVKSPWAKILENEIHYLHVTTFNLEENGYGWVGIGLTPSTFTINCTCHLFWGKCPCIWRINFMGIFWLDHSLSFYQQSTYYGALIIRSFYPIIEYGPTIEISRLMAIWIDLILKRFID